MIVFECDADEHCVGIDHRNQRNRELKGTVSQLRPSLYLDRDPAPIVDAVHQRIHAAIKQRQEHMQPAMRLHNELDPNLPLDQLTDNRGLAATPGRCVQPLAAVISVYEVLVEKSTGARASRFTSSLKMSGRP